jgi:hypothetical protein
MGLTCSTCVLPVMKHFHCSDTSCLIRCVDDEISEGSAVLHISVGNTCEAIGNTACSLSGYLLLPQSEEGVVMGRTSGKWL